MPASSQSVPSVRVSLKAAKSMGRRHPWIFSGAVVQTDADIEPGATVQVRSARDGHRLALGAFSPHSQIRIRIWSFDPDARVDSDFFHQRLSAAIQLRRRLPLVQPCTALRLVNAESDGLPGLIVDQYGDYLVCQFLSAGTEKWKSTIVEQLSQLVAVNGIYERSDADVRSKEGLEPVCGVLRGQAPNGLIEIRAGDLRLLVDIHKGHKTGLYLDQRENQARVAGFCPDAQVLNCFCYSGAFGLWALKGGAERVIQVDASQELLDLAERNRELNGQSAAKVTYTAGNVFEVLRHYRDSRRRFDLIVLDPPKFVAGAAQLNKGTRGYKDINLLALKLLRPGGVLFTFSCSGLVPEHLFQKIIADAVVDSGRQARIIGRLGQAADHPVSPVFPEGHYLKGLICMVD